MKTVTYAIVFCTMLISCADDRSTPNKFSDATLVEIYDLKDKRNTEGLVEFFGNENVKYRMESALAFGSIQDTLALPELEKLLKDEEVEVRLAAAFAIGQTGHVSSIPNLRKQLENEESAEAIYEMLLAYGNCTDVTNLNYLTNFEANANIARAGKAWGLYKAGLKNVSTKEGSETVLKLLSDQNKEVQIAASNYFARGQLENIEAYQDGLFKAFETTEINDVKSNIARAIGRIDTESAQKSLIESLAEVDDYLVMVSILNSLNPKYEPDYIEQVKELVLSKSSQVAVTAANVLFRSKSLNADELAMLLDKMISNRAKATLYGKLLELKDKSISNDIKLEIGNTEDNYYKGELLKVLSNDPEQLDYIAQTTFSTESAYIRTSGITGIQNILASGYGSKEKMAEYFKRAIQSNDIGLIWAASQTLSNTANGLKNQYKNFAFLEKAKRKLVLPIDAEAMIAIQNVIDIYNGRPKTTFKNPYNNPIDWEHVKSISKDQKVILNTEKGKISWQLNVEESPGTTEFFLRLVKKGFYDGLTFHRVVPNFVAQGGCPRGDGFGGTPESIRSEFGFRRYQTGSVGVASAGKDTESCQFFITHSATPHLNGRYTIFAQVIEGMDIAQKLELGDKIASIEIL